MRIKPGHGYYDVTSYPLGGAFRRAGESGLEIVEITRTFKRFHGCDTQGKAADGRAVAFASEHTDNGHASD